MRGRFLVVGSGIKDVLGWAVAETIGKSVFSLVVDEGSGKRMMEEWMNRGGDRILKVKCKMVGNEGQRRPVKIVLYHSRERSSAPSIIIQVKAWGSTANQRSYEELEALESDQLREDMSSSSFRIQQVLPAARGSSHCDWGRTPELCEYEGQQSLKRLWGGDMNGLPAFMDGIMVLHVLLCFFFLGHLYTNNHNYMNIHTDE